MVERVYEWQVAVQSTTQSRLNQEEKTLPCPDRRDFRMGCKCILLLLNSVA